MTPFQTAQRSMMIVHNTWNNIPSFKLIPLEPGAPYIDVIFDPEQKGLGIVSKEHKPKLQYVARLDENGEAIVRKGKLKAGDEPYQVQRTTVDAYYEYYLMNAQDIRDLVEKLAVNPEHAAFRYFFPHDAPYVGMEVAEPNYGTEIQANPRLQTEPEAPEVTAALDPELTPDNHRPITEQPESTED